MTEVWCADDLRRLGKARSYTELLAVALEVARRLPTPVSEVCGPVTTGGKGSLTENLKWFGKAIEYLKEGGHNVFDQRPVEPHLQRLTYDAPADGYPVSILYDFYLPLFESGAIHRMHFMPEWETSVGARWEREQAERLGIEIIDFPFNWDPI